MIEVFVAILCEFSIYLYRTFNQVRNILKTIMSMIRLNVFIQVSEENRSAALETAKSL